MRLLAVSTLAALFAVVAAASCGARTDLSVDTRITSGGGVSEGGAGGVAGMGGMPGGGGIGGMGGEGGMLTCEPGEVLECGSNVGECMSGVRECVDGVFGDCLGAIEPVPELCNALDDNCNGSVDEGFGLGQACDGPDSDLCFDDVVTCDGCSLGENTLESCNGLDDNCNGIIDSDCDVGDCQPSLLVTSTTPSSPSCINFPVSVGSTGSIQYPCTGGPVSAVLSNVLFSGSVVDGNVLLTGTEQVVGPDNCMWQIDHAIQGNLSSGMLNYSYTETLLDPPQNCWLPCTEVGTVDVQW